jgi:two-component system, cell cycle sensor histidine kinase and response regulator CckA
MPARGVRAVGSLPTFEQFLESTTEAVVGVAAGRIVLANEQAARLFGYELDELPEQAAELLPQPRLGRRRDGTEFPVDAGRPPVDTGEGRLDVMLIREARDPQPRDARLETAGRLADAVAHDFNNLLGVIINYAQFAADAIAADSPARRDLEQVQRAAERAAALTRQLQMFSRRGAAHPERLDLNRVTSELEPLLRRAIGEHIELETRLAPGLWTVEADPGQIAQQLVDLALRARDAMAGGGRLIVETANVELDGRYVRLAVSGAEAATTAEIHVPAISSPEAARPATVLVVEDEPSVRYLTERILARAGYYVLVADGGPAALEVCERSDQQIDLLLTDVVMPEMLGPEVVERARAIRPALRALYMSGYVPEVVRGLDATELDVIEKPFTADSLLSGVRNALEAR